MFPDKRVTLTTKTQQAHTNTNAHMHHALSSCPVVLVFVDGERRPESPKTPQAVRFFVENEAIVILHVTHTRTCVSLVQDHNCFVLIKHA